MRAVIVLAAGWAAQAGVDAAREAALGRAAGADAVRRADVRRPYTPGPVRGEVIPAVYPAVPVPQR